MSRPLDLDALYAALGGAGLRVDVDMAVRARHLLALGGVTEARSLRAVIAALVVKSDEARADFDRIFDAWWDAQQAAARASTPGLRESTPEPDGSQEPAVRPRPTHRRWHRAFRWILPALASLSVLALLALGVSRLRFSETASDGGVRDGGVADARPRPEWDGGLEDGGLEDDGGEPLVLADHFEAPAPVFTAIPAAETVAGLLVALAGALALGLIRRKYWNRNPLPEPLPVATRPGLDRVFASAGGGVAGGGRVFLDRRNEETLVWGIGQFVSEEPTRALDVAGTVAATAASGGRPELLFRRARHHREVWLWLDDAIGSDGEGKGLEAAAFVEELAATVAGAGLSVERASFWELPERLTTARAEILPSELDERRDAALVAIFTDGRALGPLLRSAGHRPRVTALLRALGRWPRLCFVDVAEGAFRLAELLEPFELLVLAPEEVPTFLGGALVTDRRRRSAVGPRAPGPDALAWTALCALGPSGLDDKTALALRERVGLQVSPYYLDALRARAGGTAGRLEFTRPDRARLLGWLLDQEARVAGARPATSLLQRSVEAWREVMRRDDERRAAADAESPWIGTPAWQYQQMERALLDLWRADPEPAIEVLYRLHAGPLGTTIGKHLRGRVPFDWRDGATGAIVLPFRLSERSPSAVAELSEMGLGRDAKLKFRMDFRRSGALWAAAAGAAALVVGGVGVASSPLLRAERVPRQFVLNEPPDAAPLRINGRSVEAGSRRWDGSTVVPRGMDGFERWTTIRHPCRRTFDYSPPQARWLCGRRAVPLHEPQGPWWRRTAVLMADPGAPAVQRFAADLLDAGSFDVVEIRAGEPVDLRGARLGRSLVVQFGGVKPGAFGPDLFVPAVDAAALRGKLAFDGEREIGEVWEVQGLSAVEAERPRILGIGRGCADGQRRTEAGLEWVRVCAGEFLMGSPDSDKDAQDDEKPAHKVRLSEFWINKTEVSNAEYRKFKPEHKSTKNDDALPVADVDWDEAKAFCEWAGGRLPTEAEWEYAARGSGARRYPWGDDPPTKERAVYGRDYEKEGPDPVDSHPAGAGPFGTLHQAGNVWEWVGDWYDVKYVTNIVIDPTGPDKGGGRVLRGGSFDDGPVVLRSANRNWDQPGGRGWGVGFRCVRSPRLQHGN